MKLNLEKKTVLLLGITLSLYFIICYIYEKPADNFINISRTLDQSQSLNVNQLFSTITENTSTTMDKLQNDIINRIDEAQNNQINVENNFEKLKDNMINEIVYQTEKDLNELNYELFYKTNKQNYE